MVGRYTLYVSSLFSRIFPIPSFFTIPTVGIDFSDERMRFISLTEGRKGILPDVFGDAVIPTGIMQRGRIIDEQAFVKFLRDIRTKYHLSYVRVSIPESQVYSFILPVDVAAADDIRGSIELVLEDNIPLKTIETVFGYHILSRNDKTVVVQVVALAESVAEAYLRTFESAGFTPVSFEYDGQAIARAVLAPTDMRSSMIVDFGGTRTGITVVTAGTAVYTSTLDFGGKALVDALIKDRAVSVEEAHRLMHEYGLSASGIHKDIFATLVTGITVLKDEINKRYVYWQEKKDQFAPTPSIETIYLCGGYSTILGLADYLSVTLKVQTVLVNPWTNCVDFDEEIPAIKHDEAQSFVTAIGLALADHLYD